MEGVWENVWGNDDLKTSLLPAGQKRNITHCLDKNQSELVKACRPLQLDLDRASFHVRFARSGHA